MARFIVIEKASGTVYGDTARFGSAGDVVSPTDALSLLDRRSGRPVRGFGHVSRHSPHASYDVYEIVQRGPVHPAATEADAHDVVHRHGSFAAALVSYNS